MKLEISNNKNRTKLAVIVALVAFSTVFMLTGALLTAAYGLKPLDPGYAHYTDDTGMVDNTPYQDFIANACMIKQHTDADQTITLDTKGLEDSGLIYYDPNTCFDLAKKLPGYSITEIKPYGEDQMKITLTKQ